jgi:hypothetical protein
MPKAQLFDEDRGIRHSFGCLTVEIVSECQT